MTLLSTVYDVCDAVGIARPNTVIGNTSQDARQLLSAARLTAQDIAKRYHWQALRRKLTWQTTATEQQTDTSLTDNLSDINWLLTETFWNDDAQVRVHGPLTPRNYAYKDAIDTAGPYSEFFYRNGSVYLIPAPTAGVNLSFEYVTTDWCESSGGTGQTDWAADTDVFRLDDYLLELGMIARWLRMKRFSYAEEMREYEDQLQLAIARDGGGRQVVNLAGTPGELILGTRIPEGDWNL